MAEDLLGGLLGGEEEAAEAEDGDARSEAGAFAAAVAADQAKYDPGVARAIERLLEAETAEIEEQRALRLRHLQHQSHEGKLRRFGLGLLVMLVGAFRARSVAVEPFDAPPALAARGLSLAASGRQPNRSALQNTA